MKIEKQSNNFIMSSFHEVQDQPLLSYVDSILDEDKFLLLHAQFMLKNPNFSYEEYESAWQSLDLESTTCKFPSNTW